jgi:hypothetical protein
VAFVVKDGRIERRAVKVGVGQGTDVPIMAGLAEGEMVVVGGPADLRAGQRVRPKRD